MCSILCLVGTHVLASLGRAQVSLAGMNPLLRNEMHSISRAHACCSLSAAIAHVTRMQ